MLVIVSPGASFQEQLAGDLGKRPPPRPRELGKDGDQKLNEDGINGEPRTRDVFDDIFTAGCRLIKISYFSVYASR